MLNMGTGREKVNFIILNCFNYELYLPEFMYNEIKESVKVIFNQKEKRKPHTPTPNVNIKRIRVFIGQYVKSSFPNRIWKKNFINAFSNLNTLFNIDILKTIGAYINVEFIQNVTNMYQISIFKIMEDVYHTLKTTKYNRSLNSKYH